MPRNGDGDQEPPALDIVPSTRIEPTLSISVDMKVNLGDYNSAGAFVSMSGVTAETTPEEMDRVLETGKIAWDKLRADLSAKVQAIRGEREAALEQQRLEREAAAEERAERRRAREEGA